MEWLQTDWWTWAIGGGALGLLSVLPRYGRMVRSVLIAAIRTLPPLAEYRVQKERERADIERDRALMYRQALTDLTAELERERASRRSPDGSSGSPSRHRATPRATPSSRRRGGTRNSGGGPRASAPRATPRPT